MIDQQSRHALFLDLLFHHMHRHPVSVLLPPGPEEKRSKHPLQAMVYRHCPDISPGWRNLDTSQSGEQPKDCTDQLALHVIRQRNNSKGDKLHTERNTRIQPFKTVGHMEVLSVLWDGSK